jgi:hypothetical protein
VSTKKRAVPKPTPTNAVEAVATEAIAVDSVNPEPVRIEADGVQVNVDPAAVQRATQVKNARLIAAMVHESAMLEVAFEQERAGRLAAEARVAALEAVLMGEAHEGPDALPDTPE